MFVPVSLNMCSFYKKKPDLGSEYEPIHVGAKN